VDIALPRVQGIGGGGGDTDRGTAGRLSRRGRRKSAIKDTVFTLELGADAKENVTSQRVQARLEFAHDPLAPFDVPQDAVR
jgi:hypothetical protein